MRNNGRHRAAAALAAVLLLVSPLIALAAERTPGTSPPNGLPGGVDIIGGWDYETGTWRAARMDSDGHLLTRPADPVAQPVQVWTAKTILAGVADSSAAPFSTDGYSKVYVLLRYREASASPQLSISWRTGLSAAVDSTGIWYEPLGLRDRLGRLLPSYNPAALQSPVRMQRFLLTDSLGVAVDPGAWSTLRVLNEGARVVIDLWLELVK
jgi:hypothetical protein